MSKLEAQKNEVAGAALAGRKHWGMNSPRRNPQQEHMLKLREQIDGSPVIASKFPKVKGLAVLLEHFDSAAGTKSGQVKCKLNVQHAKSALWFSCPGRECVGGGFDLSEALKGAVSGRKKLVTGAVLCQGKRKRGDRRLVPCSTELRYKLSLNYD